MAKNANGEGSIYAKGKGYEGAITVADANGRTIRRSARGATKREVKEKLAVLRKAAEAGVITVDPKVKVEDFANEWVAGPLQALDVKDSTRENYRIVVARYVVPTWGHLRLAALTPALVEKGLVELVAGDRAKSTVRLAKVTLGKICSSAERDGVIVRNPVRSAVMPRARAPRQRRAMTVDDAEALLISLEGGPLKAPVALSLLTGLRPGEVLALRWDDLDLDASPATLRVVEAKTDRGRRVLPLPAVAVELLARHRVDQARARLAAGSLWTDRGLVFPSSIGTPWDIANYRHSFQKECRDAGLGHWTPHELRHTTASWLLAKGVPLKVVSETLGHSGISVTADVYGHLLGPSIEVADTLGRLLPSLSSG